MCKAQASKKRNRVNGTKVDVLKRMAQIASATLAKRHHKTQTVLRKTEAAMMPVPDNSARRPNAQPLYCHVCHKPAFKRVAPTNQTLTEVLKKARCEGANDASGTGRRTKTEATKTCGWTIVATKRRVVWLQTNSCFGPAFFTLRRNSDLL